MKIDRDKLYSTTEVARIISVHPRTVRRYVKAGKFPNSEKLGDRYYILGKDVIAFIKQ